VLCTAACHGGTDNCQCLNFAEGVQAKKLAVGMIRKTLAGAGLNVMGSKDELVRRLADHLRQLNHDNSGDAAGGGDGAAAPAPAPAAGGGARLVASVLAASGRGEDSAAILSLAGAVISAASTTAEMRKAYRRLSVKVHPDKNGNSSDSKAAFQVVVSAFEELSRPPAEPDGDDGQKKKQKPRPKPTRIVRGNGGCHKTRVFCPRCHMLWGKAELGLEEGAYNFMMMGLKEYVCGRCACEFGCMSASHRCPHCNKGVEYHPQDYHRQVLLCPPPPPPSLARASPCAQCHCCCSQACVVSCEVMLLVPPLPPPPSPPARCSVATPAAPRHLASGSSRWARGVSCRCAKR
jgi:hypothetical protein